jgi:DNA-binding XRE family transcriptional regulator
MLENDILRFQKNLGFQLKKIREKKGVTQEWMDDKQEFGIDIKHYQSIEQGRANITIKTIYKICRKLDVHPSEIFKKIPFP